MDNEENHTWLVLVIQKINDRPLILGAPQGITITPNHILHGFRNTHGGEINPVTTVQQQLNRLKICLTLFGSLWFQEFTRRQFLLLWKEKGITPQIGDIVLFRNEPSYKNELSIARITTCSRGKIVTYTAQQLNTGERLEDAPSPSTNTCAIYIHSWTWRKLKPRNGFLG